MLGDLHYLTRSRMLLVSTPSTQKWDISQRWQASISLQHKARQPHLPITSPKCPWMAQGQPSARPSPVTQWHLGEVSPVQLSWSRSGSCSCSPYSYTAALDFSEGIWWSVFSWFSIWTFSGVYFAALELWNALLKSIPKDVKALSRSSCILLFSF